MTARRLPVLTCDGRPGGQPCQRAVWLPADTTISQVRSVALARGWSRRAGRDYCGDCDGHPPVAAR